MNDPFAMLDPTAKPGQPQAGSGSFATAPYGGYTPGFQQQQQQQQPSNPFAAGNPPMMAQWQQQQQPPQQQQQAYPYGGAIIMTQQGPPAFGGLAAAPNMMTAPYMPQPQQQQQMYPPVSAPMPPYGGQAIAYDSIKNLMQPKAPADPFATNAGTAKAANPFGDSAGMGMRPAEPTSMPHPPPASLVTQSSAIVVDFDPFSPQNGTPRTPFDFPDQAAATTGSGGALADRLAKWQTQEAQRSQLGFSSDGFATASAGTSKVSLRDITSTAKAPGSGFDNDPFFSDGSDPFAGQTFANLDDDQSSSQDWGQLSGQQRSGSGAASNTSDESSSMGECAEDEYDVTFETGRKLGVLMERVDVWMAQAGRTGSGERRVETAVVKLVVENGAADRVGVTVGSSVVAINRHRVDRDGYANVLEMIKAAPRPLIMRFCRGAVNKDTTQGIVLTRISSAFDCCHVNSLLCEGVSIG